MKPLKINSNGKIQQLESSDFLEVGTGIKSSGTDINLDTSSLSISSPIMLKIDSVNAFNLNASALTVQPGFTLNTTGSGNINLPNNGSARFNIEGTAIGSTVTADNLSYLTSGTIPTSSFSFLSSNLTPIFSAPGSGSVLSIQALSGSINLDSNTIQMRDSSEDTVINYDLNFSSTTTLTLSEQSDLVITHAQRTIDSSTKSITLRMQEPANATTNAAGTLIFEWPTAQSSFQQGKIHYIFGGVTGQESFAERIIISVTTSDPGPFDLSIWTLDEFTAAYVEVKVIARDSDNTLNNVYRLEAGAKRESGGSATLISTAVQSIVKEERAAWDIVLNVSGNDIIVQITGEAAHEIVWLIDAELTINKKGL